jgi:hypothetical protein
VHAKEPLFEQLFERDLARIESEAHGLACPVVPRCTSS